MLKNHHAHINGDHDTEQLRYIPLTYDAGDCDASAKALIYALFPDWETTEGPVEFERFKEGITNSVRSHRPWYVANRLLSSFPSYLRR